MISPHGVTTRDEKVFKFACGWKRWLHEIKCQKPSSLWTCLLKGVVHLGHRNLVTIQDVLIKKDYSLILYKYV
ncbi:hypothetical protein HanXRQr2_Chr16g0729561 [Helianthus annuus]|uniref:Uncharacterized protein n=1 Tax=Helianthus annuus TaxID=4232 RepID=A0A9K3GWW0_HELAN|nr:hypothetical protein HanXRQr2_Chr16g0729561 [Helianthus annuus]KAJ0819729.1 hypothetical protein HanPSC8_Chr16g0699401 [Helianthus annuus]